jgi:hypothetical protein
VKGSAKGMLHLEPIKPVLHNITKFRRKRYPGNGFVFGFGGQSVRFLKARCEAVGKSRRGRTSLHDAQLLQFGTLKQAE